MYVKCEVEIPKKLNKTQREALKKFEGTLKEENYEKDVYKRQCTACAEMPAALMI